MSLSHILAGADANSARPTIRRIRTADLRDVLAKGWDDFSAMPSHAIFLCAIYPIVGIALAQFAFGHSIVPLLFPMAAGFALIGPLAAIGLYELSRRREAGLDVSAKHAFDVFGSPSIGAIITLGIVLAVIFLVWLTAANAIYVAIFGTAVPASVGAFVHDVSTTSAGWNLIVIGNGIGFLFAVVVLMISVVSFPLLLDRDVGAAVALATSVRAVWANPVTMALWGLIVAVLLFAGSLPFFFGLTVALPVLGHSTWHLYRKVVEPDPGQHVDYHRPPDRPRRYAADFPAALFPSRGGERRR